jgi:hypothetical protein
MNTGYASHWEADVVMIDGILHPNIDGLIRPGPYF